MFKVCSGIIGIGVRKRAGSIGSGAGLLAISCRWINGAAGSRFNSDDGGKRYSVIKIDKNGVWETLSLSLTELGIHPRDMDVITGNSFIPSRATLALRYDKVLVRMENVRALVSRDFCLLFDAHRRRQPREAVVPTKKVETDVTHKAARDAFATSLARYARDTPNSHMDQMPFHLRMMECLFEETSNFFNQKVERLTVVAERALEDLTLGVSTGRLQRLLPLKRSLTEVEHDIRDTHEVMDQVLNSEEMLRSFCLEVPASCVDVDSEKAKAKVRQLAADMLFTYLREIDDAGAVLEELRKEMDAAQEVWELGLDATRNRIITTNLYISFATLSFSLATLPGSFFGMNVTNGWENDLNMFRLIAGTTLCTATILGVALIVGFRVWPRFVDRRRAQEHAALLDLLQHIDDIEEIFRDIELKAGGRNISKEQFHQILRSHPSSRFMRQREIDFLFRMFDRNQDSYLEASERKFTSQRMPKAG
ncbi:magnesium transporter MRS2-7 [Selaginella moellendorffii]|uniref:magnesium transporter MRS2-7 n=1 Tax=Selaginella moellendorffii TaxID=88036 RepID=UPI000D1CF887|nr:magnesium transporter MRS2-7 [Selaginella moellendorffii]|eukprot:XP_024520884.1 magnesium transporter MRS2-7 [Selaginella moellendorffii]